MAVMWRFALLCLASVPLSCGTTDDLRHRPWFDVPLLDFVDANAIAIVPLQLSSGNEEQRLSKALLERVNQSIDNRTVLSRAPEQQPSQAFLTPRLFCFVLVSASAVGILVLVIYEALLTCRVLKVGDPSEPLQRYGPELVSYWLNNFCSACIVTAPLATSYSLAMAMDIGPAMSGLLVTGGAVVQVLGIQFSKKVVIPWDQFYVLRFAVLSRVVIVAVIFVWVFALLCPSLIVRPWLLCGVLLTSRLVSSFIVGVATTPIAMIAIRATSRKDMTMLQSTGTAAGNFGACAGLAMSSIAYMITKGVNADIYVMSAVPMALVMVILLCQAAHLAFAINRSDRVTFESPPISRSGSTGSGSSTKVADATKTTALLGPVPDDQYELRVGIVFWSLIFSFVQNFCGMAIETGSSMLFQVQYDLSVSLVGYLIASYCLAAVFIQVSVVYVIQHGCDQNSIMMLSALLCLPCSVFVLNFGPWWQLYFAELALFALVTIINGVSSGIACNAAIPGTAWSVEMLTANGKILTCSARFFAGPASRIFVARFGRDGYNALQSAAVMAGVYSIFKMWEGSKKASRLETEDSDNAVNA